MQTTAGSRGLSRPTLRFTRTLTDEHSLVLIGTVVPEDALVVSKLREAGAVLLGHANLSEWACMRSSY